MIHFYGPFSNVTFLGVDEIENKQVVMSNSC